MSISNESPKGWIREFLSRKEYGTAYCPDDWAAPTDQIDEKSALWKQYCVFVDLYKYYLDMSWKVSVWYYATTGAILTYFFKHASDEGAEPLPFVLLFLAVISLGFGFVTWRGSRNMFSMMKALDYIATSMHLPGRPHIEFAGLFLLGTAVMFGVVGLASGALFFIEPWKG